MKYQSIKEKIGNLDYKLHKSLIETLIQKLDSSFVKDDLNRPKSDPNIQDFVKMFREIVDQINNEYVKGTISYIEKNYPYLSEKTERAEDYLNDVWRRAIKGEVSLKEFKQALDKWYSLQIQGIELRKMKLN